MGGGSLIDQHESRFREGEQVLTERKEEWEECHKEAYREVKEFGEYKVSVTEIGEYELLKGNIVVSTFAEARIEEDRILFPLSHGTLLEISSSGVREILTPEKAELCGLIAAEGSLSPYEGESRQIFFHSADMELIERYIKLFEKVYNKTPHVYQGKGEFIAVIKNKEAYYDLREIGAKTGPYRYHVPLEHLDEEGIKAYLRGFFSGDGSVARHGKYSIKLRISSKYGDCLEEVRGALVKIGFQPSEVRLDKTYGTHYLEIYAQDRIRFIEEIGSYNPAHVEKFEEFLKAYEEGKLKGGRPKKE
ncbi:MAG: LAGLIDADG family homing endonuclease [Thermoproteota archaeon]